MTVTTAKTNNLEQEKCFDKQQPQATSFVAGHGKVSFWHDSALSGWAEWGPLCPGTSDVNLLGDSQGIVDLDPKVSHGTLDPAMT